MEEYEKLVQIASVLTAAKIVFLVLSVLSLIIAIVLLFKFKVPHLILDIFGKIRQEQIKKMKLDKSNESNSNFVLEFQKDNTEQANVSVSKHGTVNMGSKKKKRKTGLVNNSHQTVIIDKKDRNNKSHKTVMIDKKQQSLLQANIVDEEIIVNSSEIIE